jgi:tetratricopeptide (TPR) repeat protein
MMMAAALVLAALMLAGCTTYGAGFSTMTGEIGGEVPDALAGEDQITGLNQDFSSFYVFGSNKYSEVSAGNLFGTMKTTGTQNRELDINGWTFNTYLKYPFYLLNDRLTIFPMAGVDLHGYGSGGDGIFGFMAYPKVGGGLDFTFSRMFFLRGRVAYAPILITGMTFNIGIGFRMKNDEVRARYKTGAEIRVAQIRQKARTAMEKSDWNAAVEAYTQIIAEDPNDAAHYFARAEAYLGAKNHDASVQDFNKGAELGKYLPGGNGRTAKWRELYREYRKAKNAEAPMNGRAIITIPGTSHLTFVQAKTPGLADAQGSGTEAALKAGRQNIVFRYSGVLNDLAAMTVGDCTLTFDLKEGHVYTAVAGFDGRNFTIRIDDVTGRETGANEDEEPVEVDTLTANMFYTGRFKKGMTIAALRRAGFPEVWDTDDNGSFITGIGNGDKRMVFGATFGGEGLTIYDLVFFSKYKNEIIDLLSNACTGPITLDNGNLSWVSTEGLIMMRDIPNNRTSLFEISILPFK